MKQVLVLGAGKSSGVLIDYLLQSGNKLNFKTAVADASIQSAEAAVIHSPNGVAIELNAKNDTQLSELIAGSEVVVSMLPPAFHANVGKHCIQHRKHLVTPSYISPAMQLLNEDAQKHNLIFLNEMGLDPGIDHMSACDIIEAIQAEGGKIISFKSHCGGLVAKESDNNPWHYKISWNPRNVVLAGQGEQPIQWLENREVKQLGYTDLFRSFSLIQSGNGEVFESYPNRDSLGYMDVYGLKNVKTFYRGTLRYEGFCQAWQTLVSWGYTDDNKHYDLQHHTFESFIKLLTGISKVSELQLQTNKASFLAIEWLGLFENKAIPLNTGTAAMVLQQVLEQKLAMNENDKDRVVMLHEFVYLNAAGIEKKQTAILDITGEAKKTAMAKTVGMPIALAVEMLLKNELRLSGVIKPTHPSIYKPVVEKLAQYGIMFHHQTTNN